MYIRSVLDESRISVKSKKFCRKTAILILGILFIDAFLTLCGCSQKTGGVGQNDTLPFTEERDITALLDTDTEYNNTSETDTSPESSEADTGGLLTLPETVSEPEPRPAHKSWHKYAEDGGYPAAIMYHLILDEPYGSETDLFVKPESFAKTLDVLDAHDYIYLFADEYAKNDKKSVALTFDDGYEDNYTNMFPILKEHCAKATIFLIADNIGTEGYLSEAQIREMADSGLVKFGSHTKTHRNLTELNEQELRYEFSESQKTIEKISGQLCDSVAYPGGQHNSEVMKIAAEYYNFAYTTKSPNSVFEYSEMNIPRHYGARSLGAEGLLEIIEY